jgi:ethanolamine utilization protein EutA (predicted chaperonin)
MQGINQAPASAKQVKIGLVCSFVNFNDDSNNSILVGAIKIKSGETLKGASLSIPLPEVQEMAMIIVANIYFESTNYGAEYIMGGKKFEAARIIEAVHFKDGKPYLFIQEDIPDPVKLIDQVKPDVFWDI